MRVSRAKGREREATNRWAKPLSGLDGTIGRRKNGSNDNNGNT